MKDRIKATAAAIREFIKFVTQDKLILATTLLWVVLFSFWAYITVVRHSVLDLFIQPVAAYTGYRLGRYGLLGLLPGGKWLSEHYSCTIKFNLKSWYWYFKFIQENTFTLDYTYISREMFKGDPSSIRETTGIGAVAFGFGTRRYIFKLD